MRDQRTYQDIYIIRMLNESQQKPKPSRQHSTHKDRQGETNDVQIGIEIEKREGGEGREENKKQFSIKNARKKTARKGNTHISGSQGAPGGGVPPRRNNIIYKKIRHQEKQGTEKKSEQGVTRETKNDRTKRPNERERKKEGIIYGPDPFSGHFAIYFCKNHSKMNCPNKRGA